MKWESEVGQQLKELARQNPPHHFILDKPLIGKHTPSGPDEGISTRNLALQAILIQQAHEAAQHEWWAEHPRPFEGL